MRVANLDGHASDCDMRIVTGRAADSRRDGWRQPPGSCLAGLMPDITRAGSLRGYRTRDASLAGPMIPKAFPTSRRRNHIGP